MQLEQAAAKAAAEQAALKHAAKAFCRVAVPALLAPLELLEDVIRNVGEIPGVAEIAATPAIIEGCVKRIGREGKAEFEAPKEKHTLSANEPNEKPTEIRPPKSSPGGDQGLIPAVPEITGLVRHKGS